MSRNVSRVVFLVVFLVLFNVFTGLLPQGGATVFIAPLLAGISTVIISYMVRGWLIRRSGVA